MHGVALESAATARPGQARLLRQVREAGVTDRQILHPNLGRSVKNGATDTCSKCGHTIPEDHVPLILWDQSGEFMWVFCEGCEVSILRGMMKPRAANDA
jgi:hypothetical protein